MNRTARALLATCITLGLGTVLVQAQQPASAGGSFTGLWSCIDSNDGLKTLMAIQPGGVASRAIPNEPVPLPDVYSSEIWGAWSPSGKDMNVTLVIFLHRTNPRTMTSVYHGEVRWRGTFRQQTDGILEGSLLPKFTLVGGGGPPGDPPAFGVKCWRLRAQGLPR